MHYAVHSRPQRRPHAADLASDRRDHSDASAAMRGPRVRRMRPNWRVIAEITPMRRPQCVGRYAADYAPTLSVHCTVVDTHMIFAYVNKFDVSSRLRQILSP